MTKKLTRIMFIIILLALLFVGSGKILDMEDSRIMQQLYVRDAQGVVIGLQSIEVLKSNSQNALIILHGFGESPAEFKDVIDDITTRIHADIYAPLLPFHGRSLDALAQLNNQVVTNSIAETINKLSKKYHSVTVLAHSYGGSSLVNVLRTKGLPDNVHLILLAPAIYVTSNTTFGKFEAVTYSAWRKYCNYSQLNCQFPAYESGDEAARTYLENEKLSAYVVIPALLKVYSMDTKNREYFNNIKRPYIIIMAKDDNRVLFNDIEKSCLNNKSFCTLYAFATGRHELQWGKNKKSFEDFIIKIVNQS